MKLQVIRNDIDKTLEPLGLTTYDRLGELIEECWEDDVDEIDFTVNIDFDVCKLEENGASRFSTGDGWDEPIQYHLRGNPNYIAERLTDEICEDLNNSELAKEIYQFVLSEVEDCVTSQLDEVENY